MLPPTASRPTSPEPGHDLAPSSVNTFVLRADRELRRLLLRAGRADRAREAHALARAERVEADEVAPLPSAPCFTSADHITPELMMSCSDERSYGVPFGLGLLERAQHRLGERVADDRHLRDALALHGLPQLVRVEVPADERDDRRAERTAPGTT